MSAADLLYKVRLYVGLALIWATITGFFTVLVWASWPAIPIVLAGLVALVALHWLLEPAFDFMNKRGRP